MTSDELGGVVDPFQAEQDKIDADAKNAENAEKEAGAEEAAALEKARKEAEGLDIGKVDFKNTDKTASKAINSGDEVDLAHNSDQALKHIMVGVGWDAPKTTGEDDEFDLDLSAFMVNGEERVTQDEDFVFYNNLAPYQGAIRHHGDNSTGEGDGDDEMVIVALDQIPYSIEKIIFSVTIHEAFERAQHFGLTQNAYIRLVDMETNKEMLRFNLTEDASGKDAIIFGSVQRGVSSWAFTATGEMTNGGLYKVAKEFGVYVAPT